MSVCLCFIVPSSSLWTPGPLIPLWWCLPFLVSSQVYSGGDSSLRISKLSRPQPGVWRGDILIVARGRIRINVNSTPLPNMVIYLWQQPHLGCLQPPTLRDCFGWQCPQSHWQLSELVTLHTSNDEIDFYTFSNFFVSSTSWPFKHVLSPHSFLLITH